MSDDAVVVATEDGNAADVICPCGFEGRVSLYDIGDGPEFNCPACDWCYPSNPVYGEDGLTNAERSLRALADEARRRFDEGHAIP